MDATNNIFADSPLRSVAAAFGGEEQMLSEMLKMEECEACPVTREDRKSVV